VADDPTQQPVAVPPLDVDGVRTAKVGTLVWAVAFLVLLPFVGTLVDDGRGWWLWTCVVGVLLGLVAIVVTTRRRDRARAASPPGTGTSG
jgi:hypothetical protein